MDVESKYLGDGRWLARDERSGRAYVLTTAELYRAQTGEWPVEPSRLLVWWVRSRNNLITIAAWLALVISADCWARLVVKIMWSN